MPTVYTSLIHCTQGKSFWFICSNRPTTYIVQSESTLISVFGSVVIVIIRWITTPPPLLFPLLPHPLLPQCLPGGLPCLPGPLAPLTLWWPLLLPASLSPSPQPSPPVALAPPLPATQPPPLSLPLPLCCG